jgi:methylenetetrahydrofolate dehydrogenase (NADP+)/methenyltetrahydrofolate cyclohydrolase
MTKLIDGKKLAEYIKDDIVAEVMNLPARPGLALLLVGNRADSELYVKLKEREAKKVGVDTHIYTFTENATQTELLDAIGYLNADPAIHGILLQLPLPATLDENTIVAAINPTKDIDGFHPNNLEKIKNGDTGAIIPPLANVVLEMCDSIKQPLKDATVALVAKSDIFTAGVGDVLRNEGARVITCAPNDADLKEKTTSADVIVTAVGKKHYLTAEYVKAGATIIDIGIIKDGNETFGDVDVQSITDVAGHLSPVPGGVGPMTIAFALKNVLEVYKRREIRD